MLTAHDLLLLVLDDETGRITPGVSEPDKAMAGAVLVDLAARGLVDVTDKGRLVMLSAEPPTEPVLRRGLAVVEEFDGRKPEAALGRLAKGLREQLAGELVDGGILRREEHKVMGLFRTNRLLANNNSYESEMRSRLSLVLSGERQPDARTGPLIALLHAMDAVTKVLVVGDKKTAKRRAKEIAQGDWAATAVRKAVQAMQAAVIASVVVASTAASS
ncbi:GOLPH3/VPS74 family protein [Kibdelosporangium aridum]|uniref:GOLPH3/VPS74 family protein n=1 Tax=Kibdelosporangium aridum TaxID=2030 RepID=UPI0035EF6015